MIKCKIDEMPKKYAISIHYYRDKKMFINLSKLSNVYDFSDAHHNTMWTKLFVLEKRSFDVEIIHVCQGRALGEHFKSAYLANNEVFMHRPEFANLSRPAIRCIQTGEVFSTQKEAARAISMTVSTISNHLNGVPGYSIIGGEWTFERVVSRIKEWQAVDIDKLIDNHDI